MAPAGAPRGDDRHDAGFWGAHGGCRPVPHRGLFDRRSGHPVSLRHRMERSLARRTLRLSFPRRPLGPRDGPLRGRSGPPRTRDAAVLHPVPTLLLSHRHGGCLHTIEGTDGAQGCAVRRRFRWPRREFRRLRPRPRARPDAVRNDSWTSEPRHSLRHPFPRAAGVARQRTGDPPSRNRFWAWRGGGIIDPSFIRWPSAGGSGSS